MMVLVGRCTRTWPLLVRLGGGCMGLVVSLRGGEGALRGLVDG